MTTIRTSIRRLFECKWLCALSVAACWVLCVFFSACANRGIGPQGGPRDSIPPTPLTSIPENGSVNFHGGDIEVTFNEYLQLDNVSQNMLMSPPQQTPPEIKARGKRLSVHFVDSLRENTTYTIDFGNAVCDYHEKNPLSGYLFSFSTGPFIDTLEIGGHVYNAEDLNPALNIFVGIHSNNSDTAFTSLPFERVARTDSAGAFHITNMHEGTYRLYAVDDVSRDYRLTTGEAHAFADSTFMPFVHPHIHTDLLGNDSLVGYEYGPADMVLWLFQAKQQRLYLQKTQREQQHLIRLFFSAVPDSALSVHALKPSEADTTVTPSADSAWIDPTPYIHIQYSKNRDTVSLWLIDSVAIAQDTIYLQTTYRRTDSLYHLEWYTDTIKAIWRAPRLTEKAKQALDKQNRNRKLELKSNARKGFEIYDTLCITSTTPLASIQRDAIHLVQRIDTIRKPIAFTIEPYDTLPMAIRLIARLEQGMQYELQLDSASLYDIYGITHDKQTFALQLKTIEDYSTLRVKLQPFVPQARIQLLDAKDKVVRELPAEQQGALFQFIKPETYYLRMYIDANNDQQWTTGSWEEKRQPEQVYYFPSKIQTKSNWDFEEEWDYTAVPQTESKPKELIQVSPKKKK